ncbi:MAG TPA: TrkA family potassium uptake protein [Chloroflexia bacterium]|nr:TrkA family potassium uptake protein [Chloroflexia bacterium]
MYIIVAGGGKVGRYLTEALVNAGHEVLLIEKNKAKVDQYTEQFGGIVVQGDACETVVLTEAGAGRADAVVAVTGDDEDNLVICQVAKRKFHVGRTIARINNPKNERIFKALGIDATVSHTQAILEMIEQELPSNSLFHLMNLQNSNLELVDAVIGPDSPAVNRTLSSLNFPPDSAILLVVRAGKPLVPRGELALVANDEVVVLTPRESDINVQRLLAGDY